MVSTYINPAAKQQFRATKHSIHDPVINVVPKVVVATAQINQSAFSYPLAQLIIDNTSFGWEDAVKPGMMVFIGDEAGSHNVGYGVVRKAPTDTVLYIDGKSKGDSGQMYGQSNILRALAEDMHITIIKFYPVWGELSRVSAQGGVFKFYDRVYAGELSQLPPVTNIGAWRQAYADEHTGTALFTFDASQSYAYLGRSMTSFEWDIDGGNVISSTEDSITAAFTPGFYIIECTGRDNAGYAHTARTCVWVNTREGADAPFSVKYGVDVRSIRSHRKGGDMSITVQGDLSDVLFPGCGVLFSETPQYGYADPVQPEVVFDRFTGYLSGMDWSKTRQRQQRELKVVSPLDKAREMASVTQYLKEVRTPNNWTEIISATPLTALDYLLRYHCSALLAQHDLIPAGNFEVLRKKTFVFQSEGLQAQLGMLEQLSLGNIGSREDGATMFCLNPLNMPPSDADAVPILFDWDKTDYGVELRYRYSLRPSVGYIKGYSFSFDGTTVIPWGAGAPGKVQSQSTSKTTMPTFIVPTTRASYNPSLFGGLPYAQFRTMEIVGQQFALNNRELPGVTLQVNRNLDISMPADLRYWHMLLDDDIKTPADTFMRMLPTKTTRQYRRRGSTVQKSISVDFEFEAFGQPGIPVDVERGGAGVYLNPDGWTIDFPSLYDPSFVEYDDLVPGDFGLLTAINSYGLKGRSLNALDESVVWERLPDSIEGLAKDIEWLPSEAVPTVLIVTWDAESETARLYSVADIDLDVPVVTLEREWGIANVDFDGELRLATSETAANGLVAWKLDNGVRVVRYRGVDWSGSIETVGTGSHVLDDGREFNIEVMGTELFVVSSVSDVNELSLYYATGAGSWSVVANFPGDAVSSRIASPILERAGVDSGYIVADLVDAEPEAETLNAGDVTLDTPDYGWCVSSYVSCAWQPKSTFTLGRAEKYVMPSVASDKLTRMTGLQIRLRSETHYAAASGSASSTPDPYYPAENYTPVPLTAKLIVRGKDDDIVYEDEVQYDNYSRPPAADDRQLFTIQYIPSAQSFDTIRVNKTIDWDVTFAEALDIATVEIQIYSDTRPAFPRIPQSDDEGGFHLRPGGVKLAQYRILEPDIVAFNKTHTVVDGKRLYLANNVDGAATWIDRTIGSGYFPETYTAFAVDPADSNLLAAIASKDGEKKLWTSDNGGVSWTDRDETQMIGVKRSGDALLLWGYNDVWLTEDLGETGYSRIGDWLDRVGVVGDIRKVLALFEAGE